MGKPVDDPKLGKTAICILKKSRFLNANEELQTDLIRTAAEQAFGEKANDIVNKCVVKKATPGETAIHIIRCVTKYI